MIFIFMINIKCMNIEENYEGEKSDGFILN